MNFTQPTQDNLERFFKWSNALRILSYVYRFCDRASLTRISGIVHDSIVLDRKFPQSIDERLNRLLTHTSIELDAHEIQTTPDRLLILRQTQYFNEEYSCFWRTNPFPGEYHAHK